MKTNTTSVGGTRGVFATAEHGVAVCRNVKCEKCGQYYHYETRHEVVGRGRAIDDETAAARAERSAELKVMQAMDARVEIVPCAFCGWVQADMVRQMQQDVAPRYLTWAELLTFYAAIFWLCMKAVKGFAGAEVPPIVQQIGRFTILPALAASALLIVARLLLRRRVNPNRHYTGNPRGVEGGMVAKQGKAPRDHLGKRELPI